MLTDYQRQLVENNIKLSYKFANMIAKKNAHIPKDDIQQIAAVGLCVAARIFDSSKGSKFSTLAYKCMLNEYKKSVRRCNRSVKALSFDANLPNSEDVYGDLIENTADVYQPSPESLDVQMDFDQFIKTKSEACQQIMRMVMSGMKCSEVARRIRTSRSYVNYVVNKIRREFSAWYYAA